VVIVPKYRKKVLYGKLRRRIGEILREQCRYKGVEIVEAHAVTGHIHMCIVLLPRKHQFKFGDKCVDHWDHAHPLGDLDANCGRRWRTP
jgi:REP element-mobilizing transposase RayT